LVVAASNKNRLNQKNEVVKETSQSQKNDINPIEKRKKISPNRLVRNVSIPAKELLALA
jgi:hypothetical protein